MWIAITSYRDDGAVDVTATYTPQVGEPFSWSATIKQSDIDIFVQTAKAELLKFQTTASTEDALKTNIEAALNK